MEKRNYIYMKGWDTMPVGGEVAGGKGVGSQDGTLDGTLGTPIGAARGNDTLLRASSAEVVTVREDVSLSPQELVNTLIAYADEHFNHTAVVEKYDPDKGKHFIRLLGTHPPPALSGNYQVFEKVSGRGE